MSFDADAELYEDPPYFVNGDLYQNPPHVLETDPSKWDAVHDLPASGVTAKSGPGTLFTVAWVLGISLGLLWVLRNGRTVFEQWQENMHRRANRRRHGIPDDDDRPFNVAYAAAALARKQREEEERKRMESSRLEVPKQDSEGSSRGEPMVLRQRSSQPEEPSTSALGENAQPTFLLGSSTNIPRYKDLQSLSEQANASAQLRFQPSTEPGVVQAYNWSMNRHAEHSEHRVGPLQLPVASSSVNRGSRSRHDADDSERIPAERRKHHEMDETEDEDRSSKKSRIAAAQDLDGINDAAWAMPGGSRRGTLQVLKRGAKRHANEEADEDWEMSQDKRARKGSLAHISNMDDVDMVMVPKSDNDIQPTRGTKRDREDAESVADTTQNDVDPSGSQPVRKRRAKVEALTYDGASRGRKRDRTYERSEDSDVEDEDSDAPSTRHKRGRRLEELEDSSIHPEDVSESESEAEISSDPACGGRRIGENWEVNGQSFKVGLDGRRLRHALVKQSRTKFPMPKDSAHRDAKTNVDIIVEKWLNDDEYKAAKEKCELAWQDASPASTPEKVPVSARQDEHHPGGKRLLWSGPPPSPLKGRSSVSSTSSVQNPFDLAPSNTGRRVASAQLLLNNKIESPKLRNSKSFSKWEKQDLEASSLKKMRARMEKQKAEAAAAAAAATKAPPAAVTPTPLAPSTNIQVQTVVVPANPDPPKPPTSQPSTQPTVLPANPFATPVTGTPPAAVPSFSFTKPTSTRTGNSAQASSAPVLIAPQNAPPSVSLTPQNTPVSAIPAAQQPTPPPGSAAQTASKPSFSFSSTPTSGTMPSSVPNPPAPSITQKPSFTFATPSAAPASSSTPNEQSKTSQAPLSFGPSSGATKNDAPKPAFNFNTGTGTFSSPASGTSGTPNFFSKPVQAPTSAATSTPSRSTGAFSFSSGSEPTQFSAPTKSTFQFGTPGGQKDASPSSGGAPSLLHRLGATQDTSLGGAQATPSQTPFGKPSPTPSHPSSSNHFGPQQSQPSPSHLFGLKQEQRHQESIGNANFFGTNVSSGSAANPNPFGTLPSAKTNPFGTLPSAKTNPFGTLPQSTGGTQSSLSFPKPSGQTVAPTQPAFSSAAQPSQQPTQSKPSFSFNFGGTGTSNNSPQTLATAPGTSADNAFKPTSNPPTGTQPQSGGFSFNFGQPPSTQPNQNAFSGFGAKPADGDKK